MPKKPKKIPKNRREKSDYPALEPEINLKSRWDEILDVKQYVHKLSEKEKKWMNKFMDEYVCDHVDRQNLKKNLHNNKRLKKSCDDRNNARNRDALTRAKITGFCSHLEDLNNKDVKIETENKLIENLDEEKNLSNYCLETEKAVLKSVPKKISIKKINHLK